MDILAEAYKIIQQEAVKSNEEVLDNVETIYLEIFRTLDDNQKNLVMWYGHYIQQCCEKKDDSFKNIQGIFYNDIMQKPEEEYEEDDDDLIEFDFYYEFDIDDDEDDD